MKKKTVIYNTAAAVSMALFCLLIYLVKHVDVEAIGPLGSEIGLASVNGVFKDAIGYSTLWYALSEWTIWLALGVAAFFCCFGIYQLISRRSLKKVDVDIYILGGFYFAVIAVYILFEMLSLNFRPVMVDGELEASFPSSHVMIVSCMLMSCAHQLCYRVRVRALRVSAVFICCFITAFALIGRALSGVHWFTDILGGILLSVVLVFLYLSVYEKVMKNK